MVGAPSTGGNVGLIWDLHTWSDLNTCDPTQASEASLAKSTYRLLDPKKSHYEYMDNRKLAMQEKIPWMNFPLDTPDSLN